MALTLLQLAVQLAAVEAELAVLKAAEVTGGPGPDPAGPIVP